MSMALSALGKILLVSSAFGVCRGIVCLHRGAWLQVAKFDEGLLYGDGGFCIDLSTVHRRHHQRCRCPQAATATTAPLLALLSCCSLVLSSSYHCAAHSLSHCAGWLLHPLSSHRPLVVLSPRRPLVVLLWLVVALPPIMPSSCPLVVPPSCPFIPTLMPTPAAHRTLPV